MDQTVQETVGFGKSKTWICALIVLGFPVLLYGFTVNLPFMCDDYYGFAAGSGKGYQPPMDKYFYNIYDYLDPETTRKFPQIVPWWTSDDVKLLFFRPLTSLALKLDYLIWGKNPFGYHLSNVVLFSLICLLLFLVGRQLFRSDVVAVLGSLIFCSQLYNTFVVSWCAERASLLSMLFGIAGLYFHIRYRKEQGKGWEFLAWLSFLAAFLSRESGATCLITYFLYDFFVWRKEQQDRWPGIIRLGITYTVLCIPLFLFMAYFVWAGYGVYGYYSILDANESTATEIFYMVKNVFLYAFAMLFFALLGHEKPPPGEDQNPLNMANVEIFHDPIVTGLFLAMLVSAAILFFPGFRKRLFKEPVFPFLASWIGISLLPIIYLLTQNRYQFPSHAPFGLFMGGYLFAVKRAKGFGKLTGLVFYGAVAFYVLLPASIITMKHSTFYNVFNLQTNTVKETREHLKGMDPPVNVFFLNIPSLIYVMGLQHAFDYHMEKGTTCVFPLVISKKVPKIEVVGERSIVISSVGRPFLGSIEEKIFITNSEALSKVGHTWTNRFFKVTVEKVVDGYIRALQFDFASRLDEESMRFFTINVEDRHVYPYEFDTQGVESEGKAGGARE